MSGKVRSTSSIYNTIRGSVCRTRLPWLSVSLPGGPSRSTLQDTMYNTMSIPHLSTSFLFLPGSRRITLIPTPGSSFLIGPWLFTLPRSSLRGPPLFLFGPHLSSSLQSRTLFSCSFGPCGLRPVLCLGPSKKSHRSYIPHFFLTLHFPTVPVLSFLEIYESYYVNPLKHLIRRHILS